MPTKILADDLEWHDELIENLTAIGAACPHFAGTVDKAADLLVKQHGLIIMLKEWLQESNCEIKRLLHLKIAVPADCGAEASLKEANAALEQS